MIFLPRFRAAPLETDARKTPATLPGGGDARRRAQYTPGCAPKGQKARCVVSKMGALLLPYLACPVRSLESHVSQGSEGTQVLAATDEKGASSETRFKLKAMSFF